MEHLTWQNFLLAMVIAAVVTFIIRKAWNFFRYAFNYPAELKFSGDNLKQVVERCCTLFPMENFTFGGKSFSRGMKIRVTTASNKSFEGKLIGLNDDNVLCVVTDRFIAADVLEHVTDISMIGNEEIGA